MPSYGKRFDHVAGLHALDCDHATIRKNHRSGGKAGQHLMLTAADIWVISGRIGALAFAQNLACYFIFQPILRAYFASNGREHRLQSPVGLSRLRFPAL